uniref:Ig-like domain-containing protein n=1 Tax=Bubo bubo TaxID=30461 RepID=A0A8C0ELF7_BUBBB
MLFSLLRRAEICLLLLCGGCQLEEFALFLGLKEAVKSDSVITAALGGEANFYCNFSFSVEVLQVTWQKRNRSSFQNIATYSANHGPNLIGSFQKKVRFTTASLKASAITIQNLTFEDESCYRCIFNVFPHGSFSTDICLNIQSKNTNRSRIKIIYLKNKILPHLPQCYLMFCGFFFFPRLKRCIALRTPAKEKGLHQDLSEKAMSLHTPKDQHVVYQNEKQTPVSSLRKRLPGLKRNLREKKNCRRLFSEEAENLRSKIHGVSEREPVGLCVEELSCTPLKEDREATAGGTVQITPHPSWSPSTGPKSANEIFHII